MSTLQEHRDRIKELLTKYGDHIGEPWFDGNYVDLYLAYRGAYEACEAALEEALKSKSSSMFMIRYHNEHAENENVLYGPYSRAEATQKLNEIAAESGDPLFKVRDGISAGYDSEELEEAGRAPDLSWEIYAWAHELKGS